MTGAMLRSIRKAYRLDVAQIANAAGLAVQTVRMTELTGKSYACGRQDRDARRRAQVWRAYLKALRVLRVGRKPVIQAAPKPARSGVLKPSPDAVLVERDGVREWVKVPKAEEAEIAAHYRQELARMQALRKQGATGRIEFESWQ